MFIMNQKADAILNIEEIAEITIEQVDDDGIADVKAGEKSEFGMWTINALSNRFLYRLGIYETEERAKQVLRKIMHRYICEIDYVDLEEEEWKLWK